MLSQKESVSWKTHWTIHKFKDPKDQIAALTRQGISLDKVMQLFPSALRQVEQVEGNVALNTGLQAVINLFAGTGSSTAFSNANSSIGVGDSSTAAAAAQTNLLAATNKAYAVMDSGYPSRSNQTVTYQATFGSGVANFSWQEFVVNNATNGSGVSLNRKVADKGTKASGETWVVQVSITFS